MSGGRRRALAAGAFIVLVLSAEVAGRWLIERLGLAGRMAPRYEGGFDLAPVLVVATKIAIGLLLARLCWRALQARRLAVAGERALARLGRRSSHSLARPRVTLSARLWLAAFLATSTLYFVPTSTGELSGSGWPLLAPSAHAVALPVFAVLAVLLALVWSAVSAWLHAYERYAEATLALARRARALVGAVRAWRAERSLAPRLLFGLAFESRPPPAAAR